MKKYVLCWDESDPENGVGWFCAVYDGDGIYLDGFTIDGISEDDSEDARCAAVPDVDPDDWVLADRSDVDEWTVTKVGGV